MDGSSQVERAIWEGLGRKIWRFSTGKACLWDSGFSSTRRSNGMELSTHESVVGGFHSSERKMHLVATLRIF